MRLLHPRDMIHSDFNFGRDLANAVVPAWTAGTQIDTDVCRRVLRTWMPAIHAGMTPALVRSLFIVGASRGDHSLSLRRLKLFNSSFIPRIKSEIRLPLRRDCVVIAKNAQMSC
jgi:hypothetical protein